MVSFSGRAQTFSESSVLCVAIQGSYGTNAFFCGLWSVGVFSAFVIILIVSWLLWHECIFCGLWSVGLFSAFRYNFDCQLLGRT